MKSVVAQLIKNYSDELQVTTVCLPSTFALHKCIEALIFFGYITSQAKDWSYSYGNLLFHMSKESYMELRRIAERNGVCFAHA